ncbi:MAG: potassium transporter Kup, partial [Gemmatimonadetes bacterium]|nr:potassium transporter Kup [Gemmatimonadota bacterium]
MRALAFATLGVVFGDIGTSPLYAFRESFHQNYGLAPSPANVLGVLSLICWALILVISVKYLVFVLRADNQGEGGILALTSLVAPPRRERATGTGRVLVLLGLFGASLLYGDGIITPAISVLSAVEGLQVATPVVQPFIVPITIAILIGLFAFQSRGTAGVARIFSPVTLVWFITIGGLGLAQVVRHPAVLAALNPTHAFAFFLRNGWAGFLVLGSVFLAVTGAEALYADMGHFGRRPIRVAWFALVLPALLLCYFGQGAVLIADPRHADLPFFYLAPEWALLPLVALATAATVIASQAVSSGAFSLTRQAVQLGYLPRVEIEHTSAAEIGQIYVPTVNWALMLACLALVLGFRSSSNLAAAYGVAVTTDMVFATLLFTAVAYRRWRWPSAAVAALAAGFLVVDLSFWGANLLKVPHGGWFPLVLAAGVFTLMTTWKTGRAVLRARLSAGMLSLDDTIAQFEHGRIPRVPGVAVFMYSDPEATPPALLHNLKHNRVLHERVVILSIINHNVPYVPKRERAETRALSNGFFRMLLNYGFKEDPNVPRDNKFGETDDLKNRSL